MIIDLAAIARAAANEAVARVRDEVREAVRTELAAQAERLESLHDILGISRQAANMKLARDPGLKALGVRVGTRLKFKRSAVAAYFASQK